MDYSAKFVHRGVLAALAAIACLVVLTACGDDSEATIDTTNPDIRGEITQLTQGQGDILGSVLIVGEIEPDTAYDQASVTIREATKVYRTEDGELVEASWDDLAEGQTVEAWFVGPVAESYPVQARAGQVVIVDSELPAASE